MAIRDKVIDTITVQPQRCKEPGYLDAMQRCLKIKHHKEIDGLEDDIYFYLQVPSAMNKLAGKRK